MSNTLDYINGINLQKSAHFIIDFDKPVLDPNMLRQNAIIFCKTDFIDLLFNFIRFSPHKYILVTHMSDYPIDFNRFSKKPNNIIKWYAQNSIFDHQDLISIPLGLENHIGKSKGSFTNHKYIEDNIDYFRERCKIRDRVYCNWVKNTNQESRKGIIENLNVNYTWEEKLSYETYCDHLSNYKFVICPPGNGVDTHRLWETLYFNSIPIVLKHKIYRDYKLPIIQVNSWSEVNNDLLLKYQYVEVESEQLTNKFWCSKIYEDFCKINK